MARGHDQYYGRRAAVAQLGRVLARRARNRCELCSEKGSLGVIEVAPIPEQPEVEWAVMLCERCRTAVSDTKRRPNAAGLRFLSEAVWHEVIPVQLCAVRLARRLADGGESWASNLLDDLYLDPEVEALI